MYTTLLNAKVAIYILEEFYGFVSAVVECTATVKWYCALVEYTDILAVIRTLLEGKASPVFIVLKKKISPILCNKIWSRNQHKSFRRYQNKQNGYMDIFLNTMPVQKAFFMLLLRSHIFQQLYLNLYCSKALFFSL